MLALLRDRTTVVWALLVLATLVLWYMGADHRDDQTPETVILLAVTFVKVRLVGMYFMELAPAPVALRFIFEAWVVVVGATVIGLYLSGA